MSRGIIHITQPTQTSCVSTCIAMHLGIDVQTVIEEFHDKYFAYETEIVDYLNSKGRRASPYREDLKSPGVYFVAVPSLNIVEGLHEILIEVKDDLSYEVFDPQKGNEGKLYYVAKGAMGHFGQVNLDPDNIRIDCWCD